MKSVPPICRKSVSSFVYTPPSGGACGTLAILVFLVLSTVIVAQKPDWRETDWSAHLAKQVGGKDEYRLPNGARIDVLETTKTEVIAWEVEWCSKWPESIGQALFYSLSLDSNGKPVRPGVWLLKKAGDDEDYLECLSVIRELRGHGIDIRLRVQKVSG